ncbi:hypothetical protein [Sphingomonas sp. LM7]
MGRYFCTWVCPVFTCSPFSISAPNGNLSRKPP